MKKANLIIATAMFATITAPMTALGANVTVKSGDTLSEIAKAHNTTVNDIKQLNNLKNNTIKIGQKLTVSSEAIGKAYISKKSAIFHHPGAWKAGTINPQNVQVLQKRSDGWIKIKTWKGDMWIKNGVVDEYFKVTQTSGLFQAPNSQKVSSINPQSVKVLQRTNNGWARISTWKGPLWMKNGVTKETITLTKTSGLYKAPGSGKVSAIGPQRAVVVQRTNNGWARISTWKGMLWVKNGFNQNTAQAASTQGIFTKPAPAETIVTSNFGPRWGKVHYGTDFARNGNQSITAAADGVVTRSYMHPSWGEVIFVKHIINGKRYDTLYAHLRKSSRAVYVGDEIKQGQHIGWMGSTGNSTGQHLHFEVHPGGYISPAISAKNPMNYLR